MPNFTENEQLYLDEMRKKLKALKAALNALDLDSPDEFQWWFRTLQEISSIQGNTSNDMSLVACLLAKAYLAAHHSIPLFDAAEKPQGAPGLDIDIFTIEGQHIIGEVKTTVPYVGASNDLGAAQKSSFQKDYDKLNNTVADHKYFFVTNQKTFEIVKRKYAHKIPSVEVVLLQVDDRL